MRAVEHRSLFDLVFSLSSIESTYCAGSIMSNFANDYLSYNSVVASLKEHSAASLDEIRYLTEMGIRGGHILVKIGGDDVPCVFEEKLVLALRAASDSDHRDRLEEVSLDLDRPRSFSPPRPSQFEAILQRQGITISLSQSELFLAQLYRQHYGHELRISPVQHVHQNERQSAGRKRNPAYDAMETLLLDRMLVHGRFSSQAEAERWVMDEFVAQGIEPAAESTIREIVKRAEARLDRTDQIRA